MTTKLAQLKQAMAAEDWRTALKIAARFPVLGDHKAAITRGWEAYARPDFYRQLGYNVEQLKADGRAALETRYRSVCDRTEERADVGRFA